MLKIKKLFFMVTIYHLLNMLLISLTPDFSRGTCAEFYRVLTQNIQPKFWVKTQICALPTPRLKSGVSEISSLEGAK